MSPNGGFPPFTTPSRFFFKNPALSLLYPYGALTSCKILEKTNEQSLTYDGRTHGQGQGPLQVNLGSKIGNYQLAVSKIYEERRNNRLKERLTISFWRKAVGERIKVKKAC